MNDSAFDTLARATDSPSGRRNAFKVMGLATIAALASSPLTAEAKNKKKKKKRKKRNRQCSAEDCAQEVAKAVAETCQSLTSPCELGINLACEGFEPCVEEFLPCCNLLSTCDGNGFVLCLNDKVNNAKEIS